MPTDIKATSTAAAAAPPPKPPSKSALVLKLLSRTKGATIEEMAEPTGWQSHSTRAFLSGLRKKGTTIAREPRKTGETAYRIVAAGAAAVEDVTAPVIDANAVTEPAAPATGASA